DRDLVSTYGWSLLGQNEIIVSNWLGKFGALLADTFIYQWFGITSLVFVLVFFVTGTRIVFKARILPLRKTIGYSFLSLIFFSTLLGFIFHSGSLMVLGGAYGYQMNQYLAGILGVVGTGALLVFSALTFLVVAYNISFTRIPKSEEAKAVMPKQEIQNEVLAKAEELISKPIELTPQSEQVAEIYAAQELELETEEETESKSNEELELEVEEVKEDNPAAAVEENDFQKAFGDYDPTLDLGSYQFPTLDLLSDAGASRIEINKEELEANKNKIVETLSHYNIGIDKIKATIGPTVTLFEIVPSAGIRISKIKNLEDDIALSLSALGIRIIAPIPGKGTIGIEVPNLKPETVFMKSLMASERFQNSEMALPIGLGKTISNEVYVADLADMPHLLMAGATGQGKSVGLNAVLISLLYKKHPSQVKFILVDPKKVELSLFKKIERHFLAKLPGEEEAIVTDIRKVVNTLNSLCIEMDQRYDLMKDANVRNIKEYNAKFIARKLNPEKGHKFLPYIVLVVDEFADLILQTGKEVEMPIARLAQLARAIGIHLIIATQRPSVNIITGTIKANFPARIAFRVTSKIDSRTILDSGGADQLVGRGDMLLALRSDIIRLQCVFVSSEEVEQVTDFIGSQRGYSDAHLLPEYIDESAEGSKEFDPDDRDALFDDAARIVVQHQQGSASLLQRRLKLGYNRAGRIIDQLEAAKIIGHFEGSKAREVLIKDPVSLEQILTGLKENI
ncbi:MAG TPA: DNA translocase FtsK 4TM domain-containing protein, partial [Bacteroidia bacterium]|nr:DNA translocase FtsK 4TM domain-containing protein [Bacteroidia bacterium]